MHPHTGYDWFPITMHVLTLCAVKHAAPQPPLLQLK